MTAWVALLRANLKLNSRDIRTGTRSQTSRHQALKFPESNGRGYWLIGFLTQTTTHRSPSGLRTTSWPDSSPVATPRPAVVHHETDTYITTYTALDPLRSAGGTVALDGFFGWPLTTIAS